ncbi:MAG: acetylglutamate kinase [Candidatus Wallbacteria bacterium]|nr:acetylglutamate kinase [Candidatus Wallbacteria bacterium]
MLDVSLLLQALPYLNQYKGKTFVLKAGGELVADPEILDRLAQDVCFLEKVGVRVVLIHGGGPQANELSERLGLKPVFVAGRRITDQDALEVTKMVFAGKINTEILSALRRHGGRAVGLSGVDGGVLLARRRPVKRMRDPETGEESDVDFGHVGDIVSVDTALLDTLLAHDYIPVLSSLGADNKGHVFNINADTVAAEIAAALSAEKLMILTNVPGVMKSLESKEIVATLTTAQAHKLMARGTVKKGMLPKLGAAVAAVESGVRHATILSGVAPHSILEETFTERGSGTLVSKSPPAPPTESGEPRKNRQWRKRKASRKKSRTK